MTKSGIVGEVAVRNCVSRKKAGGAVDAVFEPIAEELAGREQVRTAAVRLFTARTGPPLPWAIRARASLRRSMRRPRRRSCWPGRSATASPREPDRACGAGILQVSHLAAVPNAQST